MNEKHDKPEKTEGPGQPGRNGFPDLSQLQRDAAAGIPRAQFLLSQVCFKNSDLPQMLHWLKLAAASDLMEAGEALGYCHEIGRGLPVDPVSAINHYNQAIKQGSPLASYRKAELLYKSKGRHDNENIIRGLLERSAEQHFTPALRTLGYLAVENGLNVIGRAYLSKAAASGDPFSTHYLNWVRQATPENAEQSSESIPLFPSSNRMTPTILSTDPEIQLYQQVLSPADCAHLIALAQPHLERADVIDPDGAKRGVTSQARTNLSTYLSFNQVDIIGRFVEMKLINAFGGKLEHSEPMSVLCYSPGEYYQPHFDYFSPDLEVTAKHLADGGQRIASAVTCLQEPVAGGGTSFPQLDMTVPARLGHSVWFRNCLYDGQPDPRSLHAGDPVVQGQKWVVTKWFRERDSGYLLF